MFRESGYVDLLPALLMRFFMSTFEVPVRITMNSSYARILGEQGTEPVPPEPHSLMTNANATLGKQVLDLAQRSGISEIHRHRQADYFGLNCCNSGMAFSSSDAKDRPRSAKANLL